MVNFITAVAYHFCPGLPAAFTQPGVSTLADLCTGHCQKLFPQVALALSPVYLAHTYTQAKHPLKKIAQTTAELSMKPGNHSYCVPGLAQPNSTIYQHTPQSLSATYRITDHSVSLATFHSPVRLINFRLRLPNLIDQATEVIRHPERVASAPLFLPKEGEKCRAALKEPSQVV